MTNERTIPMSPPPQHTEKPGSIHERPSNTSEAKDSKETLAGCSSSAAGAIAQNFDLNMDLNDSM
ncbi:hypothetical protein QJS10_CPA16g01151 [Acorus calamus]|uniref:Uncharacterized protein n=1 Tax=Acorus calamus TaxID=4465 RepID=A0AAV9CYJ8_ACOCL|nr:hypothetical protein QJS10_CPA16g01151 [Acorus calamus]